MGRPPALAGGGVMPNMTPFIDALMRAWGVDCELVVDGGAPLPIRGAYRNPTGQQPVGYASAHRPTPALQVRSSDLAGLDLGRPATLTTLDDGRVFDVTKTIPGHRGLTDLILRAKP